MSDPHEHIVVIGAGISGLAAAWRVRELAPTAKLTVFESSDRSGGVLETIDQQGFLIERSADSFITDQPWALDFCLRIGMQGELIGTRARNRRAYVVCRGKLQPIPEAFQIMAPTKLHQREIPRPRAGRTHVDPRVYRRSVPVRPYQELCHIVTRLQHTA